jgi:hypothetical protein
MLRNCTPWLAVLFALLTGGCAKQESAKPASTQEAPSASGSAAAPSDAGAYSDPAAAAAAAASTDQAATSAPAERVDRQFKKSSPDTGAHAPEDAKSGPNGSVAGSGQGPVDDGTTGGTRAKEQPRQ